MESNTELKTWLKRLYREAPSSGPAAKKVKFSEVKDEIGRCCPSSSVPSPMLSRAISEEFPNAESKRLGKSQKVYIFGVDRLHDEGESSSGGYLSAATGSDDSALQLALQKNEDLQHQIGLLQEKIADMEQQKHSAFSQRKLDAQMGQLLRPDLNVFHGPDTLEHFDRFSVDEVIAEMQINAPDLIELFNTIGQINRHDEADELVRLSQLRVMTSLVTLLKCRSVQVLGIQLLLTFMLIARSTSKQVSKSLSSIEYGNAHSN